MFPLHVPGHACERHEWSIRGVEEEYHYSEPVINRPLPAPHEVLASDSDVRLTGLYKMSRYTGGCQLLTTAVPPLSQQPNHHQPNDL